MSRFVAVGDIHGCSQSLAKLLQILALEPGDTLLCTGDLSSKGEDSRGVHQQLIDLQQRGVRLILILGNHELMLLAMQQIVDANIDLSGFPKGLFRGADVSFFVRENETWATLRSYGLEVAADASFWAFRPDHPGRHFQKVRERLEKSPDLRLPQPHLDLLVQGKTHHIERNCLFVHSGIEPACLQSESAGEAIESQLERDAREVCWNRQWLGQGPQFPELLVHGHTPLCFLHAYVKDTTPWHHADLVFQSVIHDGALNLDSGVFLEAGHLTAVDIPADGELENFQFIRVPRLDPVCKDRLWHRHYK